MIPDRWFHCIPSTSCTVWPSTRREGAAERLPNTAFIKAAPHRYWLNLYQTGHCTCSTPFAVCPKLIRVGTCIRLATLLTPPWNQFVTEFADQPNTFYHNQGREDSKMSRCNRISASPACRS